MNIIFKIFYKFLLLYWRIVRPKTIGVKALVINNEQEILLIKAKALDSWVLPGGGVKKNENLVEAAQRETLEETGIKVTSQAQLLGVYSNFKEYKNDHIIVFVFKNWSKKTEHTSIEVNQSQFFSLKNLPDDLSPSTIKRIKEYLGEKEMDYKW